MKTVLVVDSRREARRFLERLLAARYNVLTASSGEKALECLDDVGGRQPDLVILDIATPGIDGLQLAREITDREIPVVLLSYDDGAPDGPDVQGTGRQITAYAEDLVTRPFDFDELVTRVERLLSNAEPAGEPSEPLLTPRQVEILTMLARGASDLEIALALGVSERTVKWHIGRAGQRLEANSRAHMINIALREGLISH